MDAEAHYYERLRGFAAERVTPGGIVLLGSSHLEWFDARRWLPGYRCVNRGIACDRLGLTERGIRHRLDVSLFDLAPAFIVFENGANDLGELWRHGTPPLPDIIAAYDDLIATIRTRLPHTPLLIMNLLPTTGRFAGLNPLIRALNPPIARIASARGALFLDLHTVVVGSNGELRAALTDDGLHLNAAGYALFAAALAPYLPAPHASAHPAPTRPSSSRGSHSSR